MTCRSGSNRFFLTIATAVVSLLLYGCKKNNPEAETAELSNDVVIDLNDRKQTIRNFGASDAWTFQFIGQWPDEKRNQVADWLFSMEEDETGKPKGIGLSLWRFNIGAGSAAQQNISDEWRRSEGFLNNDMSYDWSRQAGQRWFMTAAKERGVSEFVGFTNSPPVQLTKNGKAYSSNGEEANIAKVNYVAFGKFLVEVSGKFQQDGIPFTYVSPFNEPQWDWTGNGQEGSPYTNEEIFAITKILDSLIVKKGSPLKIQIAEAGKLNYLFEKADKPTRGEQIKTFFNNSSALYLGDLATVDHIISGHSYFTSSPGTVMKDIRRKVQASLNESSVPLEFWQSEYCILGDQEEIQATGKDTGIDPALYIARLIHHDLAIGNASAWHWWLALSVYDYKDGLIYADKNKNDGTVEDSKTLWALGNYSRFIRPGAVRVSVQSDNRDVHNVKSVMISSYIHSADGEVITVAVNNSLSDTTIKIKTIGAVVSAWQPYITGSKDDEELKPLAPIAVDERITIPKRSIVTLVGQLVD